MAVAMARRQIIAYAIVEADQSHGVALAVQEPGQRGGECAHIVRLGIIERAIMHRAALVHEQVAAEIGLVLESLEVVAVRARIQTPIQIARVIAWRVLAVFGEFDGEPVIRTTMQPLPKSLDHYPR